MVAVLATVAVMVIATLLIVVFRAQTIAWIIWIPISFIFIEGAPLLVFSLQGIGALLAGTEARLHHLAYSR